MRGGAALRDGGGDRDVQAAGRGCGGDDKRAGGSAGPGGGDVLRVGGDSDELGSGGIKRAVET